MKGRRAKVSVRERAKVSVRERAKVSVAVIFD